MIATISSSRRAKRAFALAPTLLILTLTSLVLFGVAEVCLQTHRASNQILNYRQARRLAQLGANEALYAINQNQSWVTGLQVAGANQSQATVTFDQKTPYWSTNNLSGSAAVTASDGSIVPANSALVFSTANYGNSVVHYKVQVSAPLFPFSIASTGPLRSSILSDSSSTDAVDIEGSPVRIAGDVVTVGQAVIGSGVEVDGQVKDGSTLKAVPTINPSDYDPAGQPLVRNLSSDSLDASDTFQGYVRRQGDLTVNGALNLQESILYVSGNLVVNGALSGVGAVFVGGSVTLGSASLGAVDQLALVSGGDMSITGAGSSASTLTGLVYSAGNLNLSGVTVVGAVVCASSTGQPLVMNNVNMLGNSAGVNFSFNLSWSGNTNTKPGAGGLGAGAGYSVTLTGSPAQLLAKGFSSTNVNANSFSNPIFCSFFTLSPPYQGSKNLTPSIALALGLGTSGQLGQSSSAVGIANMVAQNLQQATTSAIVSQGKLSLNLNRFLQQGEALQVVFREVL
jgi:hypothetical protein